MLSATVHLRLPNALINNAVCDMSSDSCGLCRVWRRLATEVAKVFGGCAQLMSFRGCEDGNNLADNGDPSVLRAPKRCQSLPMTGCTWELREAKVEARQKRWSEVLRLCSHLQGFSNIRNTIPTARKAART